MIYREYSQGMERPHGGAATRKEHAVSKIITVRYRSLDGYSMTRRFKTLAGARKFAPKWVGAPPEIGSSYAICDDGIGKITVEGALIHDLFPQER